MRILVAAASFTENMSGIQRHAISLARCLLIRPEIQSVIFVVAPWQEAMMRPVGLAADSRFVTLVAPMARHSTARNFWYYSQLPRLAAQLNADLVHLSYPMPIASAAYCRPTVVTLHDLYPCEIPMNFGFPRFIFNRIVLQHCLRSADAIACVSGATMTRLNQYFPETSWKATRVYNCVELDNGTSRKSPVDRCARQPFLLSIAQHRRNKNLSLLVRAYHRLIRSGQVPAETQLLVVGIGGPETRSLHRLVTERDLEGRVHFLEGLTEAELRWCYQQCEALVAPSITEGFGLPVAEGLLNGCRIICSDIPAHREIAENRCTLVPLGGRDEENLAAAVSSALRRPKPQAIALPQFTAPVLAEQYIGLYRQVIATSARKAPVSHGVVAAASEKGVL